MQHLIKEREILVNVSVASPPQTEETSPSPLTVRYTCIDSHFIHFFTIRMQYIIICL